MKYQIGIKGITPIMFNRPLDDRNSKKFKESSTRKLNAKELAELIELKCYKNNGNYFIPASSIKPVMQEAGSLIKKGSMGNWRKYIANLVSIIPAEISLNSDKPHLDNRFGNQGGKKRFWDCPPSTSF